MTNGSVMMETHDLFKYSCRNLLLINNYFLRQLPVKCQARINPKVFLSAFSAEINGSRVHAKDWLYAPTGYTRTVPKGVEDPSIMDADCRSINTIKFAVSEFLEQEVDGAKFIPHLVGRDVRPFQRDTKRDGPSRKRKGKNLLLLTYKLVYLEQSLAAASQKKINKSMASSKCTYSHLICLNLYD
jgi:hypothetical protein